MQYSQEHLKTMVYAKFGGQTECIMGNWKIENGRFKRRLVDFLSIEYWTLSLSLMLLVQIDKQADFISFRLFEFIWHNTLIILVYSDQMTSEARTHA